MPDRRYTAAAPAKINLVLEVLGKREDGYHEVDTILQALELADVVTLEFDAQPGIRISGRFAQGTPPDETNLAWRAGVALAERVGASLDGVALTIEKNIPAAGGLGGGASDAATVLRLLQRAWPRATDDDLRAVAGAIGSDVSFFLGGGTARGTGRGEVITQLPDMAAHGVVLFVPPDTIEQKTPRMFRALAGLPFDDGAVAGAFATSVPRRFEATDVYNAFERVAYDVFDGLAALSERLEAAIGAPVRLAGAGPTLFWIGDPAEAASIARRAEGLGCLVILTATAGQTWGK